MAATSEVSTLSVNAENALPAPDRFTVKLRSIDPVVPKRCVKCLEAAPAHHRPLSFRRADGTVERVSVVHWPYCDGCIAELAPLEKRSRTMTLLGFIQMVIVAYIVGAAIGQYQLWWPSILLLLGFFVLFSFAARRSRQVWDTGWARIDDVYKGGRGAQFSFRNREYAQLFADANRCP